MKAECCLIAVGGSGYRLKKEGIKFPYSKSSLEVLDKPMIHWLLEVLNEVGIRRVVMTSERKDSLKFVKKLAERNFKHEFDNIKFHLNPGFGSTGLPFQCRELIDFPCFFEAGHSFQNPEHYRNMDREYKNGYLIASGFVPKGYAPRFVIEEKSGKIKYVRRKLSTDGEIEVGSPKIFGKDFVDVLPKLDYDFNNIIPYYAESGMFKVVHSDMPLEADVKREWDEAVPLYENFINNNNRN